MKRTRFDPLLDPCFHAAFDSGPQDVLAAFRLDRRELEFLTGLRIALEQDDALVRYLAGEDVFQEAHRPDYQQVAQDAKAAGR